MLDLDPQAAILTAGDWNEFVFVPSVFDSLAGIYHDIDEVAGLPAAERYTYAFDMNSEQLDHIFVSPALAARGAQVEHAEELGVPRKGRHRRRPQADDVPAKPPARDGTIF